MDGCLRAAEVTRKDTPVQDTKNQTDGFGAAGCKEYHFQAVQSEATAMKRIQAQWRLLYIKLALIVAPKVVKISFLFRVIPARHDRVPPSEIQQINVVIPFEIR